ncbi:hypothetical protein JCM1840_006605 [Sporobolomyces johnsonii]
MNRSSLPSPRQRQPSTRSSWPKLSLLTIYSTEPLLPSDAPSNLSDADVQASKVLFFRSLLNDQETQTRRGRWLGTIMGIQHFASMMSPSGNPPIKSVRTSKRRLIWTQPEPGFFIHATVALPKTRRHAREPSSATSSSVLSANDAAAPPSLEDEQLLAAMERAYREYRLRFGAIGGQIARDGKERAMEVLQAYWGDWAREWTVVDESTGGAFEQVLRGVPYSTLLTPPITTQLHPLLDQFAASNPTTLPILLHADSVLSLPRLPSPSSISASSTDKPPPPPLNEDDLVALVHYLLRRASSRPKPSLSIAADLSPLHTALSQPALHPTSSGSKWSSPFTSSLALPSYLNPSSLSLPSLPTLSMSMPSLPGLSHTPSSSDLKKDFAALRRREREREESERSAQEREAEQGKQTEDGQAGGGGWGLRTISVGWGKLGLGGVGGTAEKEKKRAEDALMTPGEGATYLPAPSTSAPATCADSDSAGPADPAPSEPSPAPEPASSHSIAADRSSTEPDSSSTVSTLTAPSRVVSSPAVPDTQVAAARTDEPTTRAVEPTPTADIAEVANVAGLASSPTSPAVELAPNVDVAELAEALGASPPLAAEALGPLEAPGSIDPGLDEGGEGPESEAEGKTEEVERKQEIEESEDEAKDGLPLELFCGSEDTPFEVRTYERGLLTLAFATLPLASYPSDQEVEAVQWLSSRAERLLEAVETVLETAGAPPTAAYRHRHFVKHGLLVASHDPSRERDLLSPEHVESSAALLDSFRSLHAAPPILESLTRLSTSHWVLHRRTLDPVLSPSPSPSPISVSPSPPAAGAGKKSPPGTTDVFAVLPPKNAKGRDASLIDAADELRRLERAFVGSGAGWGRP